MIAPYRRILAVPGAKAFTTTGLIARMPIAMMGIGVVILVQRTTGSYGVAGAVAATVGTAQSLAAPPLSRLADLHGQARVLTPVVLVQGLATVLLVGACVSGAPTWTYYPIALVMGLAWPSVGSLVRARWSHVLTDSVSLHTAFSLESVLDELIFIIGPLLAAVLATAWHPSAGLLLSATCAVSGGLALAALRATAPPPQPRHGKTARPSLWQPGVVPVILTLAGTGIVFGAVDVVVVAFSAERGVPWAAGALLALWALGSLLAGLAYGAVQWSAPLPQRLLAASAAFAAGTVVLPTGPSVPVLAILMLLAGAAISPVIIAAYGLIERLIPAERRTEGLTWAITGLTLTYAASSAVAGRFIDAHGARPTLTLAVIGGFLTLLAATVARRGLTRRGVG